MGKKRRMLSCSQKFKSKYAGRFAAKAIVKNTAASLDNLVEEEIVVAEPAVDVESPSESQPILQKATTKKKLSKPKAKRKTLKKTLQQTKKKTTLKR